MATGLSRFGRPQSLVCNLGVSGTLANHTPGQAYSGTFNVTNRVGEVTAELVSATPALPAGWTLSVNQATGAVTLAWPPAATSTLPNLNFESGDTNWIKGAGWTISTGGQVDGGSWSAKYRGVGQASMVHSQAVPVTPGQVITYSARISTGITREDFAGGEPGVLWLDANYNPIAFSTGTNDPRPRGPAFQTVTGRGVAPPGAAFVQLFVSASRDLKGRARDSVYVDNVSWSHTYATGGGAATNYAVVIRVRDGRGCQATLSQTVAAPAGPGAHRYWRVRITRTSAAQHGLSELRLFDASGVNRCLPNSAETPAFASSFVNSSNRPYNAFDGNTTSSGWIAVSNNNEWIAWDFSAAGARTPTGPVEVKSIEIFPSWNLINGSPAGFRLEWSDDAVTWTSALFVDDVQATAGAWVPNTGKTWVVF